ncbi:sigma-54 interaction domain-containing protein [Cytobacillus massiliigabonensis]|uniref:sigma-54 interaction domain-containing protein n=1 Tax=Cytobacillus massiliigabonensis TaxID=1871011 RepID=UPI0015E0F04C|nr:sigma 54-interacting transcriptional regulator [Cytobacillus massiliigabonensis]
MREITDNHLISNLAEITNRAIFERNRLIQKLFIFKHDKSFVCLFDLKNNQVKNHIQGMDWIKKIQFQNHVTSYPHQGNQNDWIYSAPIATDREDKYFIVCTYSENNNPEILLLLTLLSDYSSFRIASQRNTEEIFLKSEYQKKIVDLVEEGYLSINKFGDITFLNRLGAEILQTDAEEALGTHLSKVVDFHDELLNVLVTQKGFVNKEILRTTRKGQIHIMISAVPIIDDRKQLVGAVLPFREIRTVRNLAADYVQKKVNYHFDDILFKSDSMTHLIKLAKAGANTDSSILIEGESGTGKELIAQGIHYHSHRRNGPFIVIDCSSIPRDLIESELFGYVDGAFTGARKGGKLGKFELSNDGTVFLDELGEMPLEMQSKLLRVIQNRTITRVGGNKEIPINFRIIAATNRNLMEEVKKGNFRLDLFYRLNVLHLTVPPLRDRPEDIPIMVQMFIEKTSKRINKPSPDISEDAMNLLENYSWHGNVRELENVIERAVLLSADTIEISHLPQHLIEDSHSNLNKIRTVEVTRLPQMPLEEVEHQVIIGVLSETNFNKSRAAKKLGISRSTLYDKMRKYNILE